MKKKYRSLDQQKLKILSDKVCENIDSLLDYFNIEFKKCSKMITMSCPIHGGDNTSALNLYPEGEKYRGNWKCRTHHCEEFFKSSIIGFIRGVLSRNEYNWSKDGDEIVSFEESLIFAQNFVNQNIDDIKIDKKNVEKNNFVNTIGYINNKISSSKNLISRTKIQKALDIPSKYFLSRGYSEEVLKKYDVGDCISSGKEMSERSVVPVYDMDYKYMSGCTGRSIYEKCSKCSAYHSLNNECPPESYSWLMSKWRHSKNFKTQEYLYNYWFAKEFILKYSYAILVESPGNVWRLEEAGIHNSVAMFGSSLSDKQKMLLDMSGALSLVLIMDNDEAGQKASDNIRKKCNKTYNIHDIKINTADIGEMNIEQIKTEILPKIQEIVK